MLNQYPTTQQIRCNMGNSPNEMRIELDNAQQIRVPSKCENLLLKLGWQIFCTDPDTSETFYHKPAPDDATDEVKKAWDYDLSTGYWHWYEAMAYEFGKFMTIDDDTDGRATISQDGASGLASHV